MSVMQSGRTAARGGGLRGMMPARMVSVRGLLAALVMFTTVWTATFPGAALPARADGVDPAALLLNNEDAGADATVTKETQGEDGQSFWARRRWERNAVEADESPASKKDPKNPPSRSRGNTSRYDVSGPLVIENIVYVGKDLGAAKQVYSNEVGKMKEFPEATDRVSGNFPFPMTAIGDESAALSACNDCNSKDEIYVHRRTVVRKGPVVTVVYTYGVDKVITEDLATWFAGQAASHIPDDLVASSPAPSEQPAPSNEGQAPPENQSGTQANNQTSNQQAQQAAQPEGRIIKSRPQDLVVKLDEAGKNAEKKEEKDGSDDRSTWYQVRYERPRTFAAYRSGPVTVFSQVFVAKDRAAADQIYQDQMKQTEKFPEAKEKVGDPFELKDAKEIGQESSGLSACNASCNSDKEVYLHKRIVSRVENVVSVIYIWGLGNQEGVTDASARYFASAVANRIK